MRSSGPPEEVVEDSVQSGEGQPSVTPAIKGISTSSGKAVRNWERLSRDPEAIATAGIVRVTDRDVETSRPHRHLRILPPFRTQESSQARPRKFQWFLSSSTTADPEHRLPTSQI